jgi:hypothetical protein
MKWAGHVARMGAKRNFGYLEDKRALGRDGSGFDDNIKLDIK